ncbi:MAG: T9SS type A sorting domain-containing protein [Bacteroidales bacterium]|nr:T9SS type A sorting domain-containing protein [Bacteroidales bacterium]
MIKNILTGFFLLVAVALQAQLNKGGTPWSFSFDNGNLPEVDLVLTPPDLESVAAEDLLHPVPYRFAINLPVNAGISTQLAVRTGQSGKDNHPATGNRQPATGNRQPATGSWATLPNGDRIWLLTIQAPGANAVTVYFDRFWIPEGGRLYLYSRDRSVLLGAFSELNNNNEELFSTALIPGDQVTLEYDQPANLADLPSLHISEIAYAYRGIRGMDGKTGFGSSGDCEVNIHCEEGNNWQDEQKGIARVAVKKLSATYWCSGSLINNTRQDQTPYFLTADHCGQGAKPSDISQWIFYFNYLSPTCENPAVEPGFRSMTGAVLKAAAGDVSVIGSDFLLLMLNQPIPDTFGVWFNGWNREDIASPSGVGIHHPMGDIKKISTYTTPLVSTTWNHPTKLTHWRVTWAGTLNGHGVTEGGSSGSPIFDPNGRIVGALTGGEANCDSAFLNKPDYYGKFSYSWDMNGSDATERLDFWLDPDNTGVQFLDGIPLIVPEPEVLSSNLLIYPNPASGVVNLKSSLFQNSQTMRITLLDSWGRPVASYVRSDTGSGQFSLDLTSLPNGFYLIRIASEEMILTGRMVKL